MSYVWNPSEAALPPPPTALVVGARNRALLVAGVGAATSAIAAGTLGFGFSSLVPALAVTFQAGVGLVNARWTLNRVNLHHAPIRLTVYSNSTMATAVSAGAQTAAFANLAYHFQANSQKPKAQEVQPAPASVKQAIQISVDPGTGLAMACAVTMAAVTRRCLKQRHLAYAIKDKRRGRSG